MQSVSKKHFNLFKGSQQFQVCSEVLNLTSMLHLLQVMLTSETESLASLLQRLPSWQEEFHAATMSSSEIEEETPASFYLQYQLGRALTTLTFCQAYI